MIVKDVTKYLEKIAPLHLQESYDNSGLQVGDYNSKVKGVLVSLDVTLEVIDDAINKKCTSLKVLCTGENKEKFLCTEMCFHQNLFYE